MGLAGRSPRELKFRLQQAAANVWIWANPPRRPRNNRSARLPLPDPVAVADFLRGSTFESELLALAQSVLEHRFPIFGAIVATGPVIEWRRDYLLNKISPLNYFKRLAYLDVQRVGDHKNIWELNRHQHLVALAQAYLFTGEQVLLSEIQAQLEGWQRQNPFLKGMNWTSALEVAFRALSWLWTDHLTGICLEESLYQHGVYLEHNLSTYFSPNTHLLGEGVALHALGIRLGVEHWRTLGTQIVATEWQRQVRADGSHFEQSTYYHLYALDFFLFHYILAGRPEPQRAPLIAMARFLAAIVGPSRLLTCFGDDDGGRLFHPYGPRDRFARATLATCAALFPGENFPFELQDLNQQAAWWLGVSHLPASPVSAEPRTQSFPDSGLTAIAGKSGRHILFDAGPMGPGGAGHSHSDALSFTMRNGKEEILIDPGTFTYVGDAHLRDAFRGSAFHNTLRIGRRDQANAVSAFRWEGKPAVRLIAWDPRPGAVYLDAECTYGGFRHRRRILVYREDFLFVLDEADGPPGVYLVEQFWHLGSEPEPILFSDPVAVRRQQGLRSRVLGNKEPCAVLCASWETQLPHICGAAVFFGPAGGSLLRDGLALTIPGVAAVSFSQDGFPAVVKL